MIDPVVTVYPGETSPVFPRNVRVTELAFGTAATTKLAGPDVITNSPATNGAESSTGTVTFEPMLGTMKFDVVIEYPLLPFTPFAPLAPDVTTVEPGGITVPDATSPGSFANASVTVVGPLTCAIVQCAGPLVINPMPASIQEVSSTCTTTSEPGLGTTNADVVKVNALAPDEPGTLTGGTVGHWGVQQSTGELI